VKKIKVCNTYIWRQHNETQQILKKVEERVGEWKYNGWDELVQGTLHTCMELSQWNSFILLMYANSKIKLKNKIPFSPSPLQSWITLLEPAWMFSTLQILTGYLYRGTYHRLINICTLSPF
jgi:hypothetical protein